MKIPHGWDSMELKRCTPHGEFEVTAYADGEVYATHWKDGSALPIGGAFSNVENAMRACELEIEAYSARSFALCGPVNVDADGREVSP